jgi:hypothetical protein
MRSEGFSGDAAVKIYSETVEKRCFWNNPPFPVGTYQLFFWQDLGPFDGFRPHEDPVLQCKVYGLPIFAQAKP